LRSLLGFRLRFVMGAHVSGGRTSPGRPVTCALVMGASVFCSAFGFLAGAPNEFASMSAEAYRCNAADCLKMSLAAADPGMRGLLKRMATAWTNLAEQAENESPQSIAQQQQQPRPSKGLDFDGLTPEEQRRALDG
jgi:hypothetical protein